MKRILCAVLCLIMAVTIFAGCNSGEGDRSSYSIWLYSAQSSEYYKDYSENPVLEYLRSMEQFSGIELEFWVPASGSEQNNYNTMLNSGEFPDLMDSSVADSAQIMYENGYILDLTDMVKEYMPNYYKLIQENSELKNRVVFEIDGQERILSINSVYESVPYTYCGMVYRRDWIVKYGTDPSTDAKFTGGYTTENSLDDWEDDVKFPSYYGLSYDASGKLVENADTKAFMAQYAQDYPQYDGSEPITISDWEWMFGIFTKAIADMGISDGYCTSLFYPGYTWAGGLCSCFGEGGVIWYQNSDGEVSFGGTEDCTRAYFTCMNNWYSKGWIDQNFNERSADSYFSIDDAAVREGKVGMWCGLESTLGGRLDTGSTNTDGIFVQGCVYPVNDVYGTDECKYAIPRVLNLDTSTVSTGFYMMATAEGKDMGPLLSVLDYMYSEEGALMHTMGLNQEQAASISSTLYQDYGLSEGAYSPNGDRYTLSSVIANDSGSLSIAASLNKLPGFELVESVDFGYADTYEKTLESWVRYQNTGRLWGSDAMTRMDSQNYDIAQQTLSEALEYMERNAYKLITGQLDVTSDKVWDAWCKKLNTDNVQTVTEAFQTYVELYPIS